jgi:hypothetical protein
MSGHERENAGSVHVNKLAVAARQLSCAIRLFFMHEDELSVHTLTAAAFEVLRDLARSRGLTVTRDALQLGFQQLANEGKLAPALIEELKSSGELSAIEAQSSKQLEHKAWSPKVANFLKHADKDPDDHLALDQINTEFFLFGACLFYLQLKNQTTPEMTAFVSFAMSKQRPVAGEWTNELLPTLRSASEADRYKLCAQFIETRRAVGASQPKP